MIFPIIGFNPEFSPAKDKMLSFPLATNPIDGSEFVQLTLAPGGVLVKLTSVVLLFTQIV